MAPVGSTGVQLQQVVCKKQADHSVVFNHFCDKKNKPKEKRRSCNSEPCSPRSVSSPTIDLHT